MYFMPKNIKIKKEIFKGFGLIEIVIMAISLVTGYFFSYFTKTFYLKLILFCVFPFLTFILLMPLPNNKTLYLLLIKFLKYTINQKVYKRSIDNYE